jgi:hypothetical protein
VLVIVTKFGFVSINQLLQRLAAPSLREAHYVAAPNGALANARLTSFARLRRKKMYTYYSRDCVAKKVMFICGYAALLIVVWSN